MERNRTYRITVRGTVPPDLSDRISQLHAEAVFHRNSHDQDSETLDSGTSEAAVTGDAPADSRTAART